MPKTDVKIIKVKKAKEPVDRPPLFPFMPVMYLELLENKEKIKQDLINKPYVPNNFNTNSDITSAKMPPPKVPNDTLSLGEDSDVETSSDISSISDSVSSLKEKRKRTSINASSSSGDDLAERLQELLEDSDSDSTKTDKYSRSRERYQPPVAPTLAELEQKGVYNQTNHVRDINNISMSEKEDEDAKRELLFKFDLLKKSYQDNSNIPEYNIYTDLPTIQKGYESAVRRLSLDSTVENYKKYLMYGFMMVEFVFGNWLGFNMQGFTQQQMMSMNNYEKLLIELGEKSYVPSGSKWPVELRLLFLIIINAAMFIVGKMITERTGSNIMSMMNTMNKTPRPASKPKRRMKGPGINPDDINPIQTENTSPNSAESQSEISATI